MYFRLLHDETTGAMSYLLADLEAGEAVLIDPRGADVPVLAAMLDERRLRLRWVLRTHEHDALIPGELDALAALGAPHIQHMVPGSEAGAANDQGLLAFGHEHLSVIGTPGHTAGCLSYLWRDRLFCGGLLAVDACPFQPRPALPEALWQSVTQNVLMLPLETLLFTGHAKHGRAVSNVFEQRRWHPWFGTTTRDEFLTRVRQLPAPPPLSPTPPSTPEPQDHEPLLRLHH